MTAPTQSLTQWLVADRREGKTTALLAWLTAGHLLGDGYPGWSRMLIVATDQERARIRRHHGDADKVLRSRGLLNGLVPLLLTTESAAHDGLRGLHPDIEFAIDDIHGGLAVVAYLRQAGRRPAIVALDGVPVTPGRVIADATTALVEALHVDPLDQLAQATRDSVTPKARAEVWEDPTRLDYPPYEV